MPDSIAESGCSLPLCPLGLTNKTHVLLVPVAKKMTTIKESFTNRPSRRRQRPTPEALALQACPGKDFAWILHIVAPWALEIPEGSLELNLQTPQTL